MLRIVLTPKVRQKKPNSLGVVQIEVATFYVTLRKPAVHHTMGSLKIDTQTHVINEDGDIIKGFYAAGEVAGGLHAGNRLGGNSGYLYFWTYRWVNIYKRELLVQ